MAGKSASTAAYRPGAFGRSVGRPIGRSVGRSVGQRSSARAHHAALRMQLSYGPAYGPGRTGPRRALSTASGRWAGPRTRLTTLENEGGYEAEAVAPNNEGASIEAPNNDELPQDAPAQVYSLAEHAGVHRLFAQVLTADHPLTMHGSTVDQIRFVRRIWWADLLAADVKQSRRLRLIDQRPLMTNNTEAKQWPAPTHDQQSRRLIDQQSRREHRGAER